MGIFGGVPSGGKGSGSSRRDRRQASGRKQSKTAARRETEQRAQVFILAGIVVAALLVVGIGAFGYYQTNIKPMHATVLKVGSRTFQMNSVESRIAYDIKRGAALTGSDPQVAVAQTLNTMESEEITRLNAAQQNISVSEDEIDKQIRTQLAIPDTADQSTYADAYRSDVKKSGLSVKEYREIIAAKLLEDKIRWVIAAGISPTADQVHLLDIEVSSQTDAQSVVDRLNGGEDFVAVAQQVSLDTTTKDKGADMGWMPKASLESSAGDAVFALDAGKWTEPVSSPNTGSYYVYKVTEKATAMAITTDQQKTIEDQTFQNQQDQVTKATEIARPYITDQNMWTDLAKYAQSKGAGAATTP